MNVVTKTPAPLRLPFTRGQQVAYRNGQGVKVKAKVQRVVNVKGATRSIRYYAIDAEPGLLVPQDRLLHTWEV